MWGVIGGSRRSRASGGAAARDWAEGGLLGCWAAGGRLVVTALALGRRRDHPGRCAAGCSCSYATQASRLAAPRMYVLAFPHGANGCTRLSRLVANGNEGNLTISRPLPSRWLAAMAVL